MKNTSRYRNRQFRRSKKKTHKIIYCSIFEYFKYESARMEKMFRSFFKSDEEYEKFCRQAEEIRKSRKI